MLTLSITYWRDNMPIYANNNSIANCMVGNNQVTKIVFNNQMVWENWVEKTGKIGSASTSSSSDWFSTSKCTFDKPIVPKQVYCYFTYNYYKTDESGTSTSGGGGFNYTCKDGASSSTSDAPYASVGTDVFGRPSSGTASKTTAFTDTQIEWFKKHGGIVQCWYNGGGGSYHGTQSCGGYINGYLQKGN